LRCVALYCVLSRPFIHPFIHPSIHPSYVMPALNCTYSSARIECRNGSGPLVHQIIITTRISNAALLQKSPPTRINNLRPLSNPLLQKSPPTRINNLRPLSNPDRPISRTENQQQDMDPATTAEFRHQHHQRKELLPVCLAVDATK